MAKAVWTTAENERVLYTCALTASISTILWLLLLLLYCWNGVKHLFIRYFREMMIMHYNQYGTQNQYYL